MGTDRIAWHPAFFQAIQAELVDFLDVLTFDAEHVLNAEPLKVDILVIKKPENAIITKNIGKIFKSVNIIEFKSRTDSISFKDFHKVCAYAHLYMALNNVPVTNTTISLITSSFPRSLINYFIKTCGYSVSRVSNGVYIITGDVVPIQVVNTKKLLKSENIWLAGLSGKIEAQDLDNILQKKIGLQGKAKLDAYINVITEANPEVLKEVFRLTREKARVQQILKESDLYEEIVKEKMFKVAESMYADGDSIDKISRNTNIAVGELNQYFDIGTN
jgi:hypothetical protein